jgi:hypothetical protein
VTNYSESEARLQVQKVEQAKTGWPKMTSKVNSRQSSSANGGAGEAPNGSERDEAGTILILALIFLLVVGGVVGSLTGWATNDLNNTAQFASARTEQYAVSSAAETALQNIRYAPLFSTQLQTTAAAPSYCWGTSSPSQLKIDNITVAVWCSTVYTPASSNTRLVTLSACPVTPTESAASCASTPALQAVVTFGDYPPGYSAPNTSQCQVYCGTSLTVDSWTWGAGFTPTSTTTTTVPSTTTTTTTVPPTTTTTTVPPTTTTTTVPPTTTTTTVPPTTTTTTTSNGVTVSVSNSNYNYYGGQELLNVNNPSSLTALSITINVAQTTGTSYASQFNSFPGGAITQGNATSGGYISFTYVLGSGQSIPAGFSGQVGAQWNGTGSTRVTSGDKWTVTSTSGGVTSTLSGTF